MAVGKGTHKQVFCQTLAHGNSDNELGEGKRRVNIWKEILRVRKNDAQRPNSSAYRPLDVTTP